MAVRKAETIYLGDASSVVKAAAAAQKANAEYAAKTKASATQIVAAQDRIALAGKKAADAAIKAGDSQARAATLAGRASMDQAKAVGASTTEQVSAYRRASEAAIASSEKAAAAQKASSDKQMASAKASGAATVGFLKNAATGFLGMAAASVYAAVKFQKNMELMHTQAGASTQEVTRMSKAVLNLGLTTEQGPNALVKALYPLESVGLRGTTALQALTAASHGAAVGQADLTDTTHALAGVMVALHENGGQAAAQMGAIDAVVGVGKMTMQDFVDSLKSGIVPTAHAVGLSFQSMASGLATLTDAGVPAEMAATKMRTILLMLAHEHTSAAVDGLKAVGLTADQLAGAMRAPGNGLLNVLTLLHDHMQGLSKIKQVDLLSSLAGGSRSAGTLITLMQQMDRVGNKYKQIGDLTHQFNSRVAAESDTASHKIKVAWSIIQVAAITLGQKLLPVVSSVLGSIEKFVQEMVKGQGAGGQFKTVIVNSFNAVKSVVMSVASVVKTVGSAFVTLMSPLGGLKNVIPAVIAGFVAFKIAAVVAVNLMSLAKAIAVVRDIGLGASLMKMTSPLGLVAAGVGVLVTAFMLLKGHEESEAAAAKAVAEAKQKEAQAIQAAQDAALGAADATFNQIHAAETLRNATDATSAALKKYGVNSAQYKKAVEAEKEASLGNVEAQHQLAEANAKTTQANKDATTAARERIAKDKEQIQTELLAASKQAFFAGTSIQNTSAFQKVRAAVADYVKGLSALSGATNQAQLQQFQLQRLMQGGDLITNRNAGAVANLARVLNSVPKSVQTKLLAEPQNALAAVGNLVGKLNGIASRKTIAKLLGDSASAQTTIANLVNKLHGVVSLKTIAKILGDSSNAQQAIQGLEAVLGGLPGLAHSIGLQASSELASGFRDGVNSVLSAEQGLLSAMASISGNTVLPGPRIGAPHKAMGGFVAGFARGGLFQFGSKGPQGPDNIPVNFGGNKIMVGSGEVGMVANPRQQDFLNARTADVGGLAGVFQKFARGGYASGGTVPSNAGTPGSAGAVAGVTFGQQFIQGLFSLKSTMRDATAATLGRIFLDPATAAIAALGARSTALQNKYAAQDSVIQRKALVGNLIGAKRSHSGINAAQDALNAFDLAGRRTKALGKIDAQVTGLQQLKAYSDAIAGIRSNLTSLAQTAAQTWRTAQEGAINAAHDAAIAAATTARANAQAATDNGPQSTQLAALQATDASVADAAQTKQLNDALASANQGVTDAQTLVAHSGGQAHVDAIAALATAVQAAKDAQTAIDTYQRSKDEAALQAQIDNQNKVADAAQTAAVNTADLTQQIALAGLDKQQTDFQNALDAKLQAETTSLAQRKENYKKWAGDVNAILAQYGLTAPVDSTTEVTVDTGPGAAKPPKHPATDHTTNKAKNKPKPHRAGGGPVDAYTPYYVGERGMETFVPDRPGVILTAQQTRKGGGGDVIIQGNLNVNSARHAKVMAQQLAFKAHVGAQ